MTGAFRGKELAGMGVNIVLPRGLSIVEEGKEIERRLEEKGILGFRDGCLFRTKNRKIELVVI